MYGLHNKDSDMEDYRHANEKDVHFIWLDGNFLLQIGCDFRLRSIRLLPEIEGLL